MPHKFTIGDTIVCTKDAVVNAVFVNQSGTVYDVLPYNSDEQDYVYVIKFGDNIQTCYEEADCMMFATEFFQHSMSEVLDKVDALESELSEAVTVAFNRGATMWVQANYPAQYERLVESERVFQELISGLDKE